MKIRYRAHEIPGPTGSPLTRFLGCLLLAALLSPLGLLAQGSCTVPHGLSGAPQGLTIATMPPGSGWVQLTMFRLDTRDEFNQLGSLEPYFAEGHLTTTSLLATAAVGVITGVEVRLHLPVHSLHFDEVSGSRKKVGVGDPRLGVRVDSRLLGLDPASLPVSFALNAGVKFPGSEFPIDAQLIPLTEGQTDRELALELGRSFAGGALQVIGWAGYRWRGLNEKADRKPGNERFAYLSVGGPVSRFTWRVGVQGLSGAAPRVLGLLLQSDRRSMLEVFPTLGMPIGSGVLEVGARVPIDGRNLPAGNAVSLSFFLPWGLGGPSVVGLDEFP